MPLYALTIFLGAFLLFLVQPLIGKFILPWFGGSPGVWTTCLLFFQTLLLVGYAYAHYTSTRLKPRTQATAHLVLLGLALAWLPIIPGADWKPGPIDEPTSRILLLLTATLGLPYLLLSATGPLLQRWFHLAHPDQSPYRLYALSNVGSLLALVGFPFAIEPLLSRTTQAWAWSAALVLFAGLCGTCAWRIRRLNPVPPEITPNPAAGDTGAAEPDDRPDFTRRLYWLALPAAASILLVATTSKLCTDVAVIPFLWVLPLAIYLLSFILCFDSPRWYHRGFFSAAFVLAGTVVAYLLTAGTHAPIVRQIAGYSAALFVACMICHGEAYRLRPPPRHLTGFYLTLSLGGALGGLFVAVVAPAIFSDCYELHLGYWALCYLFAALCLVHRQRDAALGTGAGVLMATVLLPLIVMPALKDGAGLGDYAEGYWTAFRGFYGEYHLWAAGVLVVLVWSLRGLPGTRDPEWKPRHAALPLVLTAVLGAIFIINVTGGGSNLVAASRNFYGTLKVRSYGEPGSISHNYLLSHGVTTHGLQFAREPYRNWLTSYYGAESGVGLAIDLTEPTSGGRNLGLVGLGTGTVSALGMPGDRLRIYEINPAVLELARERFTFLANSAADVKIVLGDARLSLENELAHDARQDFDVLALDAFSSDAIPIHLLTAEAMELYLQHLKPGGIVAIHISNRYLDLRPAIEGLARHFKLHLATISHDPKEEEWWLYRSTWCLLTRDPRRLSAEAIARAMDDPSDATAETVLWTDDHASLIPVLK